MDLWEEGIRALPGFQSHTEVSSEITVLTTVREGVSLPVPSLPVGQSPGWEGRATGVTIP